MSNNTGIFSSSAWSTHAEYYPTDAIVTVLRIAFPTILFPILDGALQKCPDGEFVIVHDAACGPGSELGFIIDRYAPGGEKEDLGKKLRVVASDFAQGMVDQVKRTLSSRPDLAETFRAEVQDVQRLNVPPSSVSFALLLFGPMFLPDPATALKELHRVLKPSGTVLVATWHSQGLFDIFDATKAHVFSLRGTNEKAPSVYDNYFVGPWASLDYVKSTLLDAGLVYAQGREVEAMYTPEQQDADKLGKVMATNPGMQLMLAGLKDSEMGLFRETQGKIMKERFPSGPPRLNLVANFAWATKA